MKRLMMPLLLMGLITTMFFNPVLAVRPLTVQINGSVVSAPAAMDVVEGQVMVPLRWAADKLGATSVQWDASSY